MKVSKSVTVNLGNYESLKVGVEDTATYEEADEIIIAELIRLEIAVSSKIQHVLGIKKMTTTSTQLPGINRP